MIGDVCSKAPVVNAVLEEVCQRHRCVREAMDEDGFEKSLGVMNGPASSGDATKNDFD